MIKIQKQDFNVEKEIENIKSKHSKVGAVSTFIGYVRDINNLKDVKYLNLEVYKDMAKKELSKILLNVSNKWNLTDSLIIHRYGKLFVNEKIVLVACFAEHRKDSIESCNLVIEFLKKDAPFWKKEFYNNGNEWLKNFS
tara:strand:+ start:134 stop:550 length:417 start_codon:yes stop_codon:yes gene_type:complete